MDRTACVNIPALPLQLLLLRHPAWQAFPAVVVDEDKPQGLIQWANRHAQRYRIRPGMRYAAGLSLSHELRAGTVSDADIAHITKKLLHQLFQFSPHIEPSSSEPGLYWLDLSGLLHLYASPQSWVHAVHADVRQTGLHSVIVIGFSRFATAAIARASRHHLVCSTPDEEQAYTHKIPIDSMGLPTKQRDQTHPARH